MTETIERAKYETVRLDADISGLSANQKEMIKQLIVAAKAIDQVFLERSLRKEEKLT